MSDRIYSLAKQLVKAVYDLDETPKCVIYKQDRLCITTKEKIAEGPIMFVHGSDGKWISRIGFDGENQEPNIDGYSHLHELVLEVKQHEVYNF